MKLSRIMSVGLLLAITGCAHEMPPRIEGVPTGAIEVKEGQGRLFFKAVDPGVIYLYDADTASLVLTQPIIPPQRFIFDANEGRVTVEGRTLFADPKRVAIKLGDKTIKETTINESHTHRIYFEPGPATGPTG